MVIVNHVTIGRHFFEKVHSLTLLSNRIILLIYIFTILVNIFRGDCLHITYKTKTLEKECIDISKATRSYGLNCARILHRRIRELKASESVEEMIQHKIGRCHALKGNYDGKYALDLEHPFRLILERVSSNDTTCGIQIVLLLEVKDYHGQ
ncbi:proteic killer suppression protein [Acidaminobacter hydrogenoformans DSM 2784]|uniref:Proteic killer suppression protein n=1 Tax=Acidaminobacter hydrogenoformans DSM 2784 TaxID=1120920 RepID=A0A1G5S6U0_9FIRM|nr:proteic killer suppression protein [Acidaminobacter hydrogenoformans DSM 2784]